MRKDFCAARFCSSRGSTTCLNWSNGLPSRKKNDSFVIIASTTSRCSSAFLPERSVSASAVEIAGIELARHRRQPAFDQVELVLAEDEAGVVEQIAAEPGEIVLLHDTAPQTRRR